jgi:hypothetical protein
MVWSPEPPPAAASRRPARLVIAAAALVVVGMILGPVIASLVHRVTRAPGRDGNQRILFVGDSLVFEASLQMDARFEEAGVETRYVGHPGTGLLSGQGWWNREVSHAVETWRPDVVVLEACCNYRMAEPGYQLADGTTIQPGSAAMYAEWESKANDAVDRAGRYGASVFWVTTPAASPELWPAYQDRIARFNEIYAGLGVELIDWNAVLTPDGTFTPTVDVDGQEVKVRDDDGLHFTAAGNALVVEATFEAVAPKFDVG